MKKNKLPLLALGLLALGAISSIALQSHAQAPSLPSTQSVSISTDNTDGIVDQKDQNGKDIETNDDSVVSNSSISVRTEKNQAGGDTEENESANDADGGANED